MKVSGVGLVPNLPRARGLGPAPRRIVGPGRHRCAFQGDLMGVLLYYPTVNPPTEIIHQALLYWDGIASVVPRDPRVYETVASEELRRLEERELYRPLAFTGDSLDALHDPDSSVSPWLAGQASSFLAQELRRIAARADQPPPTSPPEAVIYTSKTTYWLERLLVELGLASGGVLGALAVSKEVQTLIIGVLARELAVNPEIAQFPYTDSEDAFRNALRPTSPIRSVAWEVELGRLLPVPALGTPPTTFSPSARGTPMNGSG